MHEQILEDYATTPFDDYASVCACDDAKLVPLSNTLPRWKKAIHSSFRIWYCGKEAEES